MGVDDFLMKRIGTIRLGNLLPAVHETNLGDWSDGFACQIGAGSVNLMARAGIVGQRFSPGSILRQSCLKLSIDR